MSTGEINFRGVDLEIEYEATPYRPAVYYLSNGDPGYPEEGGDFDIGAVYVGGVDIFELLTEDTLQLIATAYLDGFEPNDDRL